MKIFNRVMALTMIVLLVLLAFVITAPPARAIGWSIEEMQTLIKLGREIDDERMDSYLMGYRDSWFSERMMEAWTAGKATEFIDRWNECGKSDAWHTEVIATRLSVLPDKDKDMGFGLWWEYYVGVSCPKLTELRRTYYGEQNEVSRLRK